LSMKVYTISAKFTLYEFVLGGHDYLLFELIRVNPEGV